MTKDTHVVAGIATTIAIIGPSTFKDLAICIATASIGSVISDVDVTTSSSRKELIKIIAIAFAAVITCIVLESFFNMGILGMIKSQTNLVRILCGIGLFLSVCGYGIATEHRTFMHSALCVIALYNIIWLIFPAAALPFGISMLSHILLDFLNTKKVRFFYPLKKVGIALKICPSDGKFNKSLGKFAASVCILELILFSYFRIENFLNI